MTTINTVNNNIKATAGKSIAKTKSSSGENFASLVSSLTKSKEALNFTNIDATNTINLDVVDSDKYSKQQARKLLSQLQQLKLRLIHGQLSSTELEELSLALDDTIMPAIPSTRQILAEIRTRVAVELAKYNKS